MTYVEKYYIIPYAGGASGWLAAFRKGGDAMSDYGLFMLVFAAMTFVVGLIGLVIYIVDTFSKRK